MAKSKEITTNHNPQLQKSLDVINGLKSQIDPIGEQLMLIKVVDDTTLAICQQNLSKANSVVKTIEEKRVELKAPYLDAGKSIDALCKSITEIAMKGITHAKSEVAEWERKRLAIEAQKQAELDAKSKAETEKVEAENTRKKAITDYINLEMTPWLQQTYNGLKSVAECDTFLETIKTRFPGIEKFQEYLNDANKIKDNYIALIESKKAQLSATDNISDVEKAILQEKADLAKLKQELASKELAIKQKEDEAKAEKEKKEAEAKLVAEKEALATAASLDKTKGIRYNWRYQVVDDEKIPQGWMMLDDSKVKEYIADHKKNLVDGYIINGIKFYKEASVIA